MNGMRLATWNVNSIRARVDRVTDWLERADVDVLAMQETKCSDEQFPTMPFAALGYEVVHCGFSQWNGVAIASRIGIDDVTVGFDGQPTWGDGPAAAAEARALGATCGGVRVWSLYVPNGRVVDDPHYHYKLEWLARLRDRAVEWAADGTPVALCGDWNVAPQDEDVWSMEYFADKTHVSPPERAAFHAFLDAGFTDVVRPHAPGPGTYTYWDYQQLAFPKRRGMRIDFILGSHAFADAVVAASIHRDERKGEIPSDHVPVVVDLDQVALHDDPHHTSATHGLPLVVGIGDDLEREVQGERVTEGRRHPPRLDQVIGVHLARPVVRRHAPGVTRHQLWAIPAGMSTATTFPFATRVSPARTVSATTTLRSVTSSMTPRSSSSTPIGVGAR